MIRGGAGGRVVQLLNADPKSTVNLFHLVGQSLGSDLDLYLIVSNYSTNKHPKVHTWLAQRTRLHVHYTPTYTSWLNQVERWFGIVTRGAIRRGSFSSVKELVARISSWWRHTTKTQLHSSGQPRRIQSWKSCKDFARESPGRHTRPPAQGHQRCTIA
jgi:transposase